MITAETHEHALNCDTHNGRYCDCGLTGMSAVHFYKEDGEPVYKEPVLKVPPFAPGNIFGTSLEIIANNQARIEQLRQKIEELRTENAGLVSKLSEGLENRLPALTEGKPDFFGRYNSLEGAARNLAMIGSPFKVY